MKGKKVDNFGTRIKFSKKIGGFEKKLNIILLRLLDITLSCISYRAINTPRTRPNRLIRQFETEFDCRIYVQWTDNYVCDQMIFEDCWESMIDMTKALMFAKNQSEKDKAWTQFALEHWVILETKI